MFESIKRGNKRAIIILLIIVLASAQFILIGKYGLEGLISYAADTGEGSVTLDFEVENINKANIGEDGTGSYGETWDLNLIQGTGLPASITMTTPEVTTFYKTVTTTEGEETVESFEALTDVSSVYASTGLFKEQLTEILVNSEDNGAEGKLQIKNADTNAVLFEVTETNIAEQEDFITFTYSANISKISIALENINTEAEGLTISHSKYVSGLSTNYINNNTISKIESKLNFIAGTTNETYTAETYVLRTTKASLGIDNNNTTSDQEVDNKNTLFLGTTNDVKFTIDLHTESKEYELYSNPSFVILFPTDYVKTASMFEEEGSEDLIISGGFELTDYAVQTIDALGATAIAFTLEGTQTNWASSADQNASIELNVSLELEDEMPDTIKPITLYYKNSGITQYEVGATNEANVTCGKLTQDIILEEAVAVNLQNIASITEDEDETGGTTEDGTTSEEENTTENETVEELNIIQGDDVNYILSIEISKRSELEGGKITIKNTLPEGIELKTNVNEDNETYYEIYELEEVIIENTDEDTGEVSTTITYEEEIISSSYNKDTRELTITLNVDENLPIIKNETTDSEESTETVTSYSIGSITRNIKIIATVSKLAEGETEKEIINSFDIVVGNGNTYTTNEVSFIALPIDSDATDENQTKDNGTTGGEANEAGISAYMQTTSSTRTSSSDLDAYDGYISLNTIKNSSVIFCRDRGGLQGSLDFASYSLGAKLYDGNNSRYSYILTRPWTYYSSIFNCPIQRAIWKTGSQDKGSGYNGYGLCTNAYFTGDSYLYWKARRYETYMNEKYELSSDAEGEKYIIAIKPTEINGKDAVLNENGTVGPFELNYYEYEEFGGIKEIIAYGGETNETANTEIDKDLWEFVDANGTQIDEPNGKDKFYIKINNMDYLTENNIFFIKLKIIFKSDEQTEAACYDLDGEGGYNVTRTSYCSNCQSIINSASSNIGSLPSYYYNGSSYYYLDHRTYSSSWTHSKYIWVRRLAKWLQFNVHCTIRRV